MSLLLFPFTMLGFPKGRFRFVNVCRCLLCSMQVDRPLVMRASPLKADNIAAYACDAANSCTLLLLLDRRIGEDAGKGNHDTEETHVAHLAAE